MGLISRIFGTQNEPTLKATLPIVQQSELWTNYTFTNATKWDQWYRLYKENPVIQGCILAYALTMPEAPIGIQKGELIDLNHPLALMMAKQYQQRMMDAHTYIGIGGNAYEVKQRIKGVVTHTITYSDKFITPKPDRTGVIEYYLFKNGTEEIPIPVEDVIHLRGFWVHPEKPWMGMSPIELATTSIDTYNEATRLTYNLYKNDGVPKTIIVYPREVDNEQKQLVAESFKVRHGGANKGSIGVLDDGADIKRLALDMDESAQIEVTSVLATRICQVMRVHPIMAMDYAGLVKMTYNNFKQASVDFTDLTRIPYWKILQSQITYGWQPEYPNIECVFDLSNVEALKPDPNAKAQIALQARAMGDISEDEFREAIGMAPKVVEVVADDTDATTSATVDIAAQAMNGAQIASLLEIVAQASAGLLSIETARGICAVSFPTLTSEQLDNIFAGIVVGTVDPSTL